MPSSIGTFPFGEPVRRVTQQDRTPKRVFVLGVYASAVHARWISAQGKTVVQALAVAGEPYIFWRGENPEATLRRIDIPEALGKLVPAHPQFNGPSGLALDQLILAPLGLSRADVWLCDLVPHSCANDAQRKAIARAYLPLIDQYDLPRPTVPPVPHPLTDEPRRAAILDELAASGAETLILLGDQPIRWFLAHFDPRWRHLSDFDDDGRPYGSPRVARISGRTMDVIPLAHPRQIARLGKSSPFWYERHKAWLRDRAGSPESTHAHGIAVSGPGAT